MIKDGTFFRIEAFMRTDLNLKGNELMAYALIYGFQKATGKPFDGSQDFISEWLGISRQHTISNLQNLVDKGFLKIIKSGRNNAYECRLCSSKHVTKGDTSTSKHVTKGDISATQHVTKGDIYMSRKVTEHVTKGDINMSRKVTQYNNNTDNKIIHTDRERTEISNSCSIDLESENKTREKTEQKNFHIDKHFAFVILKVISTNRNKILDMSTRDAYTSAISKLERHGNASTAPAELVYAWNSYQTELKREGRQPQYMPQLKKWLEYEAVDKVKEFRAGKKYSLERVKRTVNKIVEERKLA